MDKVAGGESRVCFMAAPMFVLPEVEENPLGWGPVSDSIPEQVRPSPCRLVATRPPAHQDGRDVKSPCAEHWRLPKPHRAHRTHLACRTCTRDSITHFIIWHRTDSSRTHTTVPRLCRILVCIVTGSDLCCSPPSCASFRSHHFRRTKGSAAPVSGLPPATATVRAPPPLLSPPTRPSTPPSPPAVSLSTPDAQNFRQGAEGGEAGGRATTTCAAMWSRRRSSSSRWTRRASTWSTPSRSPSPSGVLARAGGGEAASRSFTAMILLPPHYWLNTPQPYTLIRDL